MIQHFMLKVLTSLDYVKNLKPINLRKYNCAAPCYNSNFGNAYVNNY